MLGLTRSSEKRQQLHAEVLALGAKDAESDYWKAAVWLPVWRFNGHRSPTTKLSQQQHMDEMCVLRWDLIVLYDAEMGREVPLVFYSMDGGLRPQEAAIARSQFSFLRTWHFSLNRHSNESNASGSLYLNRQGGQRMEMVGIHDWRRNKSHPPDSTRLGLKSKIRNARGELDAYVVHHDHVHFQGEAVKTIWNALSCRMLDVLPLACSRMVKALREANVCDRLYTTTAGDVVSDNLLINNVGVSESYQSPPHFDVGDVGWTCEGRDSPCVSVLPPSSCPHGLLTD